MQLFFFNGHKVYRMSETKELSLHCMIYLTKEILLFLDIKTQYNTFVVNVNNVFIFKRDWLTTWLELIEEGITSSMEH